jgi:hypothetical protein
MNKKKCLQCYCYLNENRGNVHIYEKNVNNRKNEKCAGMGCISCNPKHAKYQQLKKEAKEKNVKK